MIVIGLIQVAILLFSLLRGKGLAVMLGPEGVGVIGTMDQLVITVTQVAAFGMPIAAMKFMSAAHSVSDDAFRDSFAAFVRIMLGLALAITVVSFGLLLLAPDLLAALDHHSALPFAALLSVPPTMLTIMIAQTLAAAQMSRAAAFYNFCFVSSVAVAGLVGAWYGGTVGFYLAAAAAGITTVLSGLVWLWWRMGLTVLRPNVSILHQLTLRPNVFRTAMTAFITLVSISITMLMIRYVIIGRLGEEQTGFLQAALSLALSVGSILATVNALQLAPSMNRELPLETKFGGAVDFANRVALLMAAGGTLLALLPGLGLTILFTSEFLPAAPVLVLCLVWQALHQFRVTCLQLLIGTDHPLSGALAGVLAAVVTIGMLVWLVEPLGIMAAPVALITGTIVAIAVMVARLQTVVAMPVPWAVMARFAAASAAILAAGLLFDPGIVMPDLQGLVLRLLYCVTTFGLVWLTMPSDLSPAAALAWLRDRRYR